MLALRPVHQTDVLTLEFASDEMTVQFRLGNKEFEFACLSCSLAPLLLSLDLVESLLLGTLATVALFLLVALPVE